MKTEILRNVIFGLGLILSLSSCASKPADSRQVSSSSSLTLLFSQQRKLNIEPCGCSLGQLGGLEREYNYLAKLRATGAEPVYLIGSGGFVPEDGYKSAELPRYLSKAKTISEALAKFRVGAVAIDQSDLSIGVKEVSNLSRKFGVPFVSSNLVDAKTGKPLFLDKITLPFGKSNLAVFSLSGKDSAPNRESRKAKVLDPKDVLEKSLKSISGDSLVAVVHSLDQDEVLQLMKAYPQVSFWLGGSRPVIPEEIFQFSKVALSAEVQGWGRSILKFEIEPKLPVKELYHPDQRRFQIGRLNNLRNNQEAKERSLDEQTRFELLKDIKEKPEDTASVYRYERIDLGSDFIGSNELAPLLERSRRSLSGEKVQE